jgi:hypothetical protein
MVLAGVLAAAFAVGFIAGCVPLVPHRVVVTSPDGDVLLDEESRGAVDMDEMRLSWFDIDGRRQAFVMPEGCSVLITEIPEADDEPEDEPQKPATKNPFE